MTYTDSIGSVEYGGVRANSVRLIHHGKHRNALLCGTERPEKRSSGTFLAEAAATEQAKQEARDRDAELPHDADDLIRLIAPRLVYVARGSEDAWAGPRAEKAAWDSAHDLYEAYGLGERMGYHCHDGVHRLRADDWEKFMDFADFHLKAPSSADSDAIARRIAAAGADGSHIVVLAKNAASPDGVWRLTRAIVLPDDFTLVFDGCRVELADGVQDNLVRNSGFSAGMAPSSAAAAVTTICRNVRAIRMAGAP